MKSLNYLNDYCGEDLEEKRKNIDLQKKYFSAWGARKPAPDDRMKMMKRDLVAELASFCDVEKFKLYILCAEARNYIWKLWHFLWSDSVVGENKILRNPKLRASSDLIGVG